MTIPDYVGLITDSSKRLFLSESYLVYSPDQINEQLRLTIADLQSCSLACSAPAVHIHFVSVDPRSGEIIIVSRRDILNFEVKVPTVDEIRIRLFREGVSRFEKLALSQEVERIYTEAYFEAIRLMGFYSVMLDRLCFVSIVKERALKDLLQNVHERIRMLREKVLQESSQKNRIVYFHRMITYKSQVRCLEYELSQKTQ